MPQQVRLRSIFDKQKKSQETLDDLTVRLIYPDESDVTQRSNLKNSLNGFKSLSWKQNITSDPSLFYAVIYFFIYEPLQPHLKKLPKLFISFLILAIMLTTGLTNAGFIILLFTGASEFSEINIDLSLIWVLGLTIPGAIISGFAQKGIYQDSLENFADMVMDGTYIKIAKENPWLFSLATFCAICSFIVNLGLGLMGMGMFFASGGAPVIILSILFALANALLVYYTALDQINRINDPENSEFRTLWESHPLLVLTVLLGLISTFGLIMLLFPGATEMTNGNGNSKNIIFGILLAFAAATEVFYSWVKSHHLAMKINHAANNPGSIWENIKHIFMVLVNAAINCTPGAEGGVELAEKADTEKTVAVQAPAAVSTAFWSVGCSTSPPAEKPTQKTIAHQFNTFIRKDVNKPTIAFNAQMKMMSC